MSNLEIIEAPLGEKRLVNRFIEVPWHIHRKVWPNQTWVPPLRMDRRDFLSTKKNPFHEQADVKLWIAVRDGVDVGRIAAVVDRDFIDFHGTKTGYFGMFECPDEVETAGALVRAAEDWLRERGMADVIGPCDLSSNHVWGVLLDAFDRTPCINMPYNPPWYDRLLNDVGYTKAKDLYQWYVDLSKPLPERIIKLAERVLKREKLTVRPFNFSKWDAEVDRTLGILNSAWEKNWGFVPVRPKEYHHIAKDLKLVLHKKLGLFAEAGGEAVGFSVTILDVNPVLKKLDGNLFPFGIFRLIWDLQIRSKVKGGRLILLGLKPSHRKRGIDLALIAQTHRIAREIGLDYGELGWTLEDNDLINRAIEQVGGEKISTYRVYGKPL
jgi:GNAT superfamily N-acetyltransferase